MRKTALDTNREHFPRGEPALYKPFYSKHTHTHTHKRIHAYKYVCCWYSCRHFAFILVERVGVALLWAHFDATFHCVRHSNFATLIVELPPLLPPSTYYPTPPCSSQSVAIWMSAYWIVSVLYSLCGFALLCFAWPGKFLSAICSRT